MTDPIRALLARVKELDENATGGPWTVTRMGSIPELSIDHDGNLGSSADADLITEYRTLAPQLARALESVLEVCEHWDEWASAVMSDAEGLPEDMAARMRADAGRLMSYAAVLHVAIAKHLGGDT